MKIACLSMAALLVCACSNKSDSPTETDTGHANNVPGTMSRAYSQTPPGGLEAANVPQFVVIGADDCGSGEAVKWIADVVNKHGKMSFYVNGKYADSAGTAWKAAYAAGNEIGSHTYSHFLDSVEEQIDARKLSYDAWLSEINKNDSVVMAAVGISKNELIGFRVPRLEYNADGYTAMAFRGFSYDCSIEEGNEEGHDGSNNYWPYTLDNGSESDSLQVGWNAEDPWGYASCGKVARLWEIPVYNFIVPHDSLATKYGFTPGLRTRILANIDYFDTTVGTLTGFDYNLFSSKEDGGAAMTASEILATLKYSFDQHYSGNRTPFTLGMHPDFYTADYDAAYASAGGYMERRKILEDFVAYVTSKSNVKLVSNKELLEWLKSPVGIDGTAGK